MTTPPLRVALIGFGLAGAVMHAPLIAATPLARLTTIVTADPDRAARARREHPTARIAADAADVWDRRADHDLVVVATPNRSHAPLAFAAIRAGLDVVVDKPLAATSAQARELIEAASTAGRVLTVFQNRRWDGDFLTLRRLLAEGALGSIIRWESRFTRWRPSVDPTRWRESAEPADGGGVLLDLGSHLIDQCRLVLGHPTHVYAEIASRRGSGADDDAFLALRFAGDVHAHLWMSALAAEAGPRMRVLGTRAAYVKEHLDIQEDALRDGARPRPCGPWGAEPPSRWGQLVRGDERRTVETAHGEWPAFYHRLAQAIIEAKPPPVDPHDALAVLEIIEAARRSGDLRSVEACPKDELSAFPLL